MIEWQEKQKQNNYNNNNKIFTTMARFNSAIMFNF